MSDDDQFIDQLRAAAQHTPQIGVDTGKVMRAGRRRRRSKATTAAASGVLAIGVAVAVPNLWQAPAPVMVGATAPRTEPAAPTTPPTPTQRPTSSATEPIPCAEFPAQQGDGPDYEGWWNATPSDAEGNVLTDPADWQPEPRDHPQIALVYTGTGYVVSTYDRLTCGPIPDYTPPDPSNMPADSVVVLDIRTGEVVQSFTVAPSAEDPNLPGTIVGGP
jgi:hypothetical protein